jgi:hypothetical protein
MADLLLSPEEVAELTRYSRPAEQLAELHRQGFTLAWRARAKGEVILPRAHYDAMLQRRKAPCAEVVEAPPVRRYPWDGTGLTPGAWLERDWRLFCHTPEDVLQRLVPWQEVGDVHGVYLLFDGRQLVYIGEAINVAMRLPAHVKGGKVFDRAWAFEVPDLFRKQIEAAWIFALDPFYNAKVHTSGTGGWSASMVRELRSMWKVAP